MFDQFWLNICLMDLRLSHKTPSQGPSKKTWEPTPRFCEWRTVVLEKRFSKFSQFLICFLKSKYVWRSSCIIPFQNNLVELCRLLGYLIRVSSPGFYVLIQSSLMLCASCRYMLHRTVYSANNTMWGSTFFRAYTAHPKPCGDPQGALCMVCFKRALCMQEYNYCKHELNIN